MLSSSVHDKIQRLGAEEEPQWRREKQTTMEHEECIKMTSRTKHHDSNEYEKAPRLWYTVNSQASIGFVDNR